jgi:nucleoid-associated protein YgaU
MAKVVREIIRDLDGTQRSSFAQRWVPAVLVLSLLALAAGFIWLYRSTLSHKMEMVFTSSENETEQPKSPEVNAQTPPGASARRPSGSNTQQTPPEEPLQTEAQSSLTTSKQTALPKRKIVVRGDTLTKLANEVYGKSDNEVLGLVRDKNPQIADPDLIHTGSTIIFPDLPQQETPGSR